MEKKRYERDAKAADRLNFLYDMSRLSETYEAISKVNYFDGIQQAYDMAMTYWIEEVEEVLKQHKDHMKEHYGECV